MRNAKQKFFIISAAISVLVVGLLIGAIVAPNWVVYANPTVANTEPNFQGLFKRCSAGTCSDNSIPASARGALGLGCDQSGGQVKDRLNVTSGTLLAAAGVTALVVLLQLVHIFRIAHLSPAAHMWLFWFLIAGFVSSLVGVSLFGGTVNSWWNCGSSYCQPYKGTNDSCGIGYGYVFNIVACAVILICAACVAVFAKYPHILSPTNDVILMAVLFEIFAVCFIGIGVASPEWLVSIPNYRSVGLFQNCTAWACTGIDLPGTLTTRTSCQITGSEVTSRFSAAAALFIVAAVIIAVFAVLFVISYLRISTKIFITNTKKRIAIGFIIISLVAESIGIILATNVFDSFFFCGVSFCQFYGAGYCRHGIGFGLCMAAICLTVVLLGLHLFEFNDWCCFQERFTSGRQSFSPLKVLRGTRENSGQSPKEPTNATAPTDPHQHEEDNVIQLPAGQWEYDSVSGFYWSEELYLFYDPNTQQFYDPNKDEWFSQDRRTAGAPSASAVPSTIYADVHRSMTNRGGSFDRHLSSEQSAMVQMTSPRRAGAGQNSSVRR